tara:strand:- start:1720 stop:2670 length:951 start_codon:yes stop_codon:yes gene_type:complete
VIKKKISVIFSFYNEESNILSSIKKVSDVLDKIKEIDYELIYVDDCSTDTSLEILKKERIDNKKIKIITLSRRFGHMPGIMAGLKHCKSDAAIYTDIDLQDPPELMKEMIDFWIKENYEVVFTTRKNIKASLPMKILSKIGYSILEKVTYINITKDSGDFRLIGKKVINEYVKFREINPFFRFLVDFIGFKKKQILYERDVRIHGKTNFTFYKIFHQFFEISMIPFSDFPIRVSLIFGLTSFFICTFILIRTGFLYFTGTDAISSTSIFGAILLFGGIQSLTLGILSVYVGAILKETKKRPLYIVENNYGFEEIDS